MMTAYTEMENVSFPTIFYHPNPNNYSAHCDQIVDVSLRGQLYCPPVYDSLICWPAAAANSTIYRLCSDDPVALAHRVCSVNGSWEGYSNYTMCLNVLKQGVQTTEAIAPSEPDISIQTAKALTMVYFIGNLVSLVFLLISLFIFIIFKSLQCPRTTIHKHLIVSFILRFITILILLEPYVFQHGKWYTMEWLCRILISLQHFALLANFYWMLVEGLFLHLILVLRPLDNDKAPFAFFYLIGWIMPLIITIAWATVMHFKHDLPCWKDSTKSPYIFIIYAPVMLVLLINLLILFNLIRIVIVKLCTGHTTERRKICRTIKSTVFLVFLLGVINLTFSFRPADETNARLAYRYVNAILPPCQGIFVSLLYCVMNAEVRRAIKKKWLRFRESRHFNNSTYRRRSSRTSMTMFVSNNQNNGNWADHTPMMELNKMQDGSCNNHENSNCV